MEKTIAGCPAQMDAATLGAWRDRELLPDQAQRVEAHVHGCRACQSAITAMDLVGRAVRRFDPPQMQDAIWRDVRMNMQEQRGNRMPARQQKTAILGGLGALAIVTVLTTVILVFTATKPEASSTLTATSTSGPTATTVPSPTATPPTLGLTVAPGQDWTALKSIPNGLSIAFAASDPLTGYTCAQTGGNQKDPLAVAVTHDGGGHWQAMTTQGPIGVDCRFTVNPLDAKDVVAQTTRCFNGCAYLQAFRSRDAGRTWRELSMPPGANADFPYPGNPEFAGTTLFLTATTGSSGISFSPELSHSVAVIVDGQTPRWVDLHLFPTALRNYWYTYANAFYLVVSSSPPPSTATVYLAKSTDDGVTWTNIAVVGNTSFTRVITRSSDGKTFYDVNGVSHVISSTDGGEHWAEVPGMPTLDPNGQGRNIANPIAAASDNTVYFTDDVGLISRARPGDSGLQRVTSLMLTNRTFAAVSSDRQGHPVALWASYITFLPGVTKAQAAIQYRAP